MPSRGLTRKRSRVALGMRFVAIAALAWNGATGIAVAQGDISFAGKLVTLTVGFEAGSGPDIYGRILGQNLVRYLPGQPRLIVVNQLGAGGVVALNSWANKAEPDGLFVALGTLSQTDPDALMRTQAKYDPATFNYIGGLAGPSQGLFVNKDAVARLHDKTAKPVIMGMVGTTLRSGHYQVLWGVALLGWNVKWVVGYTRTAELRQAMERGEIEMILVRRGWTSTICAAPAGSRSSASRARSRMAVFIHGQTFQTRRSLPILSKARSRTRWRKKLTPTANMSARSEPGSLCLSARPIASSTLMSRPSRRHCKMPSTRPNSPRSIRIRRWRTKPIWTR